MNSVVISTSNILYEVKFLELKKKNETKLPLLLNDLSVLTPFNESVGLLYEEHVHATKFVICVQ